MKKSFRDRRRSLTSVGKEREQEVKALLIEEYGYDYFAKEKPVKTMEEKRKEVAVCREKFRINNPTLYEENIDDDIRREWGYENTNISF